MDAEDRAKRFRAARGKKTPNEVYKETGIMTSMISDLENDMKDRGVKYQDIAKLAKCYGVSAGYLIGTEKDPTTDTNTKAICEYTGLSSVAVGVLHNLYNSSDSQLNDKFFYTLNNLIEKIEYDSINRPLDSLYSDDYDYGASKSVIMAIWKYLDYCLIDNIPQEYSEQQYRIDYGNGKYVYLDKLSAVRSLLQNFILNRVNEFIDEVENNGKY